MCDTFVATGAATQDQINIFAKNSDRPPNEAQHLVQFPAKTYEQGSQVKCTYIAIPQVAHTHAVLLSQPFWMWGAEMGVNEHGLVIGNEAVFSKIPANKEPALLGMDLLRLALERAVTPQEAIQVIVDLLQQHGQGGNCIHSGKLYYHNSFLIANAGEAWVLETVDKEWAARRVQDVYSISNTLTLQSEWDSSSAGLVENAVQKGIAKSAQTFNFANDYSDFLYTSFGKGKQRCNTTTTLMQQHGTNSVHSMIDILRHHQDYSSPVGDVTGVDVCMHAGLGPIRVSQSTGSMVVYLHADRPTIFATGSSAPCTGIFKPVWVDVPLPDSVSGSTDKYDTSSLYWAHERLHRAVLRNYADCINTYTEDRDELESEFIQGALEISSASSAERDAYSAGCFERAAQAEADWLQRVTQVSAKKNLGHGLNNLAWKGFNRKANFTNN